MSISTDQIMEDIKGAMKAKNSVALMALRALKTALTNAAIEKGNLHAVLEESEVLAVIRKQIKQRQDSIEQFLVAGREELAQKEKEEIEVLSAYLPAAMSDEEVEALVQAAILELEATSKKEMGKVIKLAQERSEGRVDGKTLSQVVGKLLS